MSNLYNEVVITVIKTILLCSLVIEVHVHSFVEGRHLTPPQNRVRSSHSTCTSRVTL